MKSEKEKMLAGELYSPMDAQLVEERRKLRELLFLFNYSDRAGSRELMASILPNASRDLGIENPFFCDYGYNIFCGKRVYINVNCVLLDAARITLGDRVLLGPGVHIYASTHPIDVATRKTRALAKEVWIGNDCWIGGGAIICPGVRIGDNAVVGAGAVVTKDVEANTMVAGNPARLVKNLT